MVAQKCEVILGRLLQFSFYVLRPKKAFSCLTLFSKHLLPRDKQHRGWQVAISMQCLLAAGQQRKHTAGKLFADSGTAGWLVVITNNGAVEKQLLIVGALQFCFQAKHEKKVPILRW